MKTAHKVLIVIFSSLFVFSVVMLAISFFPFEKTSSEKADIPLVTQDEEKADPVCADGVVTECPLMQSDFDNIFYCVKPDGKMDFYEFNGKTFSEYAGEVRSVELKPVCTYYKIPITVYYIVQNGKTLGYGLFTTENSDAEVNLYAYVFAKLTEAPKAYGIKGKLLLLNTEPEDAFLTNKVYTEAFEVNLSGKKCSPVTSQRDRSADRNGRQSQRWSVFTENYLSSVSKKPYMISGRLYNEGTQIYDLYNLKKSLQKPVVKGIYTTFLKETKNNGLVYLKKTDDGFKSVCLDAEEKTIAQFKGDAFTDFVFNGEWVFDLKERTFTNLINGKKTDGRAIGEGVPNFCVTADGSAFAAVTQGEKGQLLSIIASDGKIKQYSAENIYKVDFNNMCFISAEKVLATAVASDGKCINYVISV